MPLSLVGERRAIAALPVDTLNLHAIASAHNFLLLHSWVWCAVCERDSARETTRPAASSSSPFPLLSLGLKLCFRGAC
jgi:hypothetical protein